MFLTHNTEYLRVLSICKAVRQFEAEEDQREHDESHFVAEAGGAGTLMDALTRLIRRN